MNNEIMQELTEIFKVLSALIISLTLAQISLIIGIIASITTIIWLVFKIRESKLNYKIRKIKYDNLCKCHTNERVTDPQDLIDDLSDKDNEV